MKHLFEARRRPKGLDGVVGFVVDFSDLLILLHRLETDTFRLNGYTAIRTADVSRFRFFDRAAHWQLRAVAHFRLAAIKPRGILVTSLRDLLETASREHPLLTIH